MTSNWLVNNLNNVQIKLNGPINVEESGVAHLECAKNTIIGNKGKELGANWVLPDDGAISLAAFPN